MLTQDARITTVHWWGDAAPQFGYRIAFYPQDPNTIALQPDIFRPEGGPIDEHDYATVSQYPVGNGLYRLEVQLAVPLDLLADTQYFVAIIGLTPLPFTPVNWAAGTNGPATGTFYWMRADGGRYYRLPENRAVTLLGFNTSPTLTVNPDPLIAGQSGSFTVDNMTPTSQTYLAYSLRGSGSTYVPQLNITLDLSQPQQAGNPKKTDANGHTVWNLPIPQNAAGRNVWFQAAQYQNKTNLVATQIN